MHNPNVTWFRLLCIACLLSVPIFIILYSRQPPSVKLSGTLERYGTPITPCDPVGQYDQYNPCLIKYVQQNLLLPPSGLPISIREMPGGPPIDVKVDFIKKHFITGNSPPGFFIECGANDGKFLSPTLKLEREFNWTGVLIEGDPTTFKQLVALHRNTWKMNAALCTKPNSEMVTFYSRPSFTPNGGLTRGDGKRITFEVPCIPLYTILTAMGITTVDFFSLDVEGVELEILKTVPYDKVIFKLLIVEHNHIPGFQPAMIDLMEPKGYKFIGSMLADRMEDSVFVHESVYTSDMSLKIKYDPRYTKKPKY